MGSANALLSTAEIVSNEDLLEMDLIGEPITRCLSLTGIYDSRSDKPRLRTAISGSYACESAIYRHLFAKTEQYTSDQ